MVWWHDRSAGLRDILTLTIIGFLVTQQPAHAGLSIDVGTTVVVFKSPTEIVAGADSMLATHGFKTIPPVFTECKIRRVGDVFFALAGTVRERSSGYDAAVLTADVLNSSGGEVIEKVTAFERRGLTELPAVVRRARDLAPSFFDTTLKNKVILQAAFFGVEHGAPFLYVRNFESEVSDADGIVVKVRGGNCTGDCDMIAILGDGTASKNYLAANPAKADTAIDLVQKLMALEIANTPHASGPPVDMVRIDANGRTTWIQRKPECPP